MAHDEQRVDVWRRTPDGWALSSASAGSVQLQALDVELPVAEIYRDPFGDAG